MEAAMLLGVALLFIGMFALFVWKFRTSEKRLEIEKGKTELYCESCSGEIGDFIGAKSSFVRVSMYDGFMVISSSRVAVLETSDIDSIKVQWSGVFLQKGLKIIHHNLQAPPLIILISTNRDRLREMIEFHLHLGKRGLPQALRG